MRVVLDNASTGMGTARAGVDTDGWVLQGLLANYCDWHLDRYVSPGTIRCDCHYAQPHCECEACSVGQRQANRFGNRPEFCGSMSIVSREWHNLDVSLLGLLFSAAGLRHAYVAGVNDEIGQRLQIKRLLERGLEDARVVRRLQHQR